MKLVPSCPACGRTSKGHLCIHFAVAIANEETLDRVRRFLSLVKEHRWPELLASNSFDVNETAIGAYALQCAQAHSSTTFVLLSDAGLGGGSRLIALELLEPPMARELTLALEERKKSAPGDYEWFPL